MKLQNYGDFVFFQAEGLFQLAPKNVKHQAITGHLNFMYLTDCHLLANSHELVANDQERIDIHESLVIKAQECPDFILIDGLCGHRSGYIPEILKSK